LLVTMVCLVFSARATLVGNGPYADGKLRLAARAAAHKSAGSRGIGANAPGRLLACLSDCTTL